MALIFIAFIMSINIFISNFYWSYRYRSIKQKQNRESCTNGKRLHRSKIKDTQLLRIDFLMINSPWKIRKGKKSKTNRKISAKYEPKRLQINHDSVKSLTNVVCNEKHNFLTLLVLLRLNNSQGSWNGFLLMSPGKPTLRVYLNNYVLLTMFYLLTKLIEILPISNSNSPNKILNLAFLIGIQEIARLNSPYEAWSYKKKKHKKMKAYRKSVYKKLIVERCLLILDLKPLRS